MNTSFPVRESNTSVLPGGGRPPASRELPMIGSFLPFYRDPLRFYTRLYAGYGGTVTYHLFNRPYCMVTDPQGVERVLTHPGYSRDANEFEMTRRIVGNGLLTSEGKAWQETRHTLQPLFHRTALEGYCAAMLGETDALLARWEALPTGASLDIEGEMTALALRIVGRAILGTDLPAAELRPLMETISEYFTSLFHLLFFFLPGVPTPEKRRFQHAIRYLDDFVEKLVAAHGSHQAMDLVSLLLATQTQGDLPAAELAQQKQHLRDEVLSFLLAGHGTVATALVWAWYLLSTAPQGILGRVHAEVDAWDGAPQSGRALSTRLPFVSAVVKETLRLYPPAFLSVRQALADDILPTHAGQGYSIRAGTTVVLPMWVTQRRPDLWQRPTSFCPERFLNGGEQAAAPTERYAYYPFGGGRHRCIGDEFAEMELTLILARIAQRYCLCLRSGHPEVTPAFRGTLRPWPGVWMVAQPR